MILNSITVKTKREGEKEKCIENSEVKFVEFNRLKKKKKGSFQF